MPKSSFYKVATDREVQNLLTTIAKRTETPISIESDKGETLIQILNYLNRDKNRKYPIEVENQLVGWASVAECLDWIPNLLSHLCSKELEKQSYILKVWEREQEINLLQDISTQITSSLEVREVTYLVLEEVGKFIPCTGGAISLLDGSGDRLMVYSEFGNIFPERKLIHKTEDFLWSIIRSKTGQIINQTHLDVANCEYHNSALSLICVPLQVQDRIIGALEIGSEVVVEYTEDDLNLLTMFAKQAAVAIEKALLYEQSRNAAAIAQEQMAQLQQALYELKHTQSQLVQSEKMSSLGELIAGVAHEINNPVNFINGNLTHAQTYVRDVMNILQLYRHTYPDPCPEIKNLAEEIELEYLIEDFPKLLVSMREGVNRICQILLSLRNFSRQDQGKMSVVNVHDCIESTLLILQHRLKKTATHGGIQVVKSYGNFPEISCYPGQLNQVFLNLLGNAIDAIEEFLTRSVSQTIQPQISIHTEQINDRRISIHIADNGIGMSEETRNQLFDAFFTTKPLGKGTGLGLSICHQIIAQKHRGSLQCISELGKGTEFIIELPITPTV